MYFKDRSDAGKKLAKLLLDNLKNSKVVVFALPRGGVILGSEIAKKFKAPLSLAITRKIGHPNNPEYAIAAVTEDGQIVGNQDEINAVDSSWFEEEVKKEIDEARRRREQYLSGKRPVLVKNKTAIIVDDGIATGLTIKAAIKAIKEKRPKKIILAVPVIPKESFNELKKEVDKIFALDITENFLGAIGSYYDDFSTVDDNDVISILQNFY